MSDSVGSGEVEDVYFDGGFANRGDPRSRYYYLCSLPNSTVSQHHHDDVSIPESIRLHYEHHKRRRGHDH